MRKITAFTLLAALPLASSALAADPTTMDCLNANEKSITLRNENKLRAAREQLLICAAASCPADVRAECIRSVEQVNASMPTLVFVVEGTNGKHETTVKVSMDGEPLAERLEGTALSVDPGIHRFRFEARGQAPVEKELLVYAGAKDRRERIVVGAAADTPMPAASVGSSGPGIPDSGTSPGRTQRILGYSAVGAGAVGLGLGVYFALKRSSTIDDRDAICPSSQNCTRDDQIQIDALTEDARSAGTASAIAFWAGGALAVGGVALVLTAPRHSSSVAFAPIVAPGFQGIAVRGATW